MAANSDSTPSPDTTTDPICALVARWHEINAARAATIDASERGRLDAIARDVESRIAATPPTTLVGVLAGLELLPHLTRDQSIRERDHQSALRLALIDNAAGIIFSIDASRRQLLLGLKKSDEIFQEAEDDCSEENSDHGRIGAMFALAAAIDAFKAQGISRESLRPLYALLRALKDAENGRRNRMFAPAKRKNDGGSPDEVRDFIAKVRAAVALELLMQYGMSKPDAMSYVYNKMKNWPILKKKEIQENYYRKMAP